MDNQNDIVPKNVDTIWIASFDIGHVNFAFYVEEFKQKALSEIKNIPKEVRYNQNGTPTCAMGKILEKVFLNGKTILHKNCNITKDCIKGKKLDPNVLYNMIDLLDSYSSYWDKCNYFVVEQQMQFGKFKINPKALRLGHHCQSYFMFRYGRFKQVVEFPAYHKTQVLGCEKIKGVKYKNGKPRWKAIDKPSRKKWGVLKATEILTNRGEEHTINNINTKTKKDDLADTLIQLQAFKYLYFVNI
jgi:hypothetical protein